ncbi:MAG: CRISPR-associated helicase Cas3' [Selenomonadaceae bacterium]|nr:CRISPR-associated helicase Cas3' [Selenomonadaceae bacterium]
MNYLGHKNPKDGSEQTLHDHLIGVSELAEKFASEFGENESGKLVGLYHDIGKYSKEFQRYIRQESKARIDHSTAGAKKLYEKFLVEKTPSALIAAFCIAGHHGGIPNIGDRNITQFDETTFYSRVPKKKIPKYDEYSKEIEELLANQSKLLALIKKENEALFALMFYTRMLFSCLVDADFLDTENFMSKGTIQRGNFTTLRELKAVFDDYIAKNFLNERTDRYNEPLNQRRRKILRECINSGRSTSESLMSLTVPTGGGKTIASMSFALNNAVKTGRRRIIYVIPYTSIIEQNAKVFSDIFGRENVVEHYSGIEYDDTESEEENIKRLATENWDAPIIVTTNVQFFESIFSNRTSKCRKLHNIANSVIIFDEAQMIPEGFLKPCVQSIEQLTKHYNCTAVICTATQPSLGILFENRNFNEICSEVEDNYNFFRRTTIIALEEKFSKNKLAERLRSNRQVLCIVNRKRSVKDIFETLRDEENVFYLTTNLCATHRAKILQEIKKNLEQNQPCRVISTSLIEAGVDLDFPCVYREIAGLDNIIQSAGRCNREGKFPKDESFVFVFTLADERIILAQKLRVNATNLVCEKYVSDLHSPQAIKYYFDFLHKLDGNLDKEGILELHRKKSMPFKDIAKKFKLIKEDTKSIFIPFDESAKEIEQKLLDGEISRSLLRRAGRYVVNVYLDTYKKMLVAQKITVIDESLAVLIDLDIYDARTGLTQEIEEGAGIFF